MFYKTIVLNYKLRYVSSNAYRTPYGDWCYNECCFANSIAIINQLYYYRKIVITIIYYIRTLPIVKL